VLDIEVDPDVLPALWLRECPRSSRSLAEVGDVSFSLETGGATLAGSAVDPPTVEAAVQAAIDGIPLRADLTEAAPTAEETAAINGTVILFVADSVTWMRRRAGRSPSSQRCCCAIPRSG
jgi:hypothetical protein